MGDGFKTLLSVFAFAFLAGVIMPFFMTEIPARIIGRKNICNEEFSKSNITVPVASSDQNDLETQKSSSNYNTKGKVRILNKNVPYQSGFEKLAVEFQMESGIQITIETPDAGSYPKILKEKLTCSPQDPTLFMLGGMNDFYKYKYECLDLSDYPVTQQLIDQSYSLKDENNNIYGLACYEEAFGLIVNTRLLEEAGFEVSEINSFTDLKRIVVSITARKSELGFSAFTSPTIGSYVKGSYRFSQHAPEVPLYYEIKGSGFNIPTKLKGIYMKHYQEYIDLYLDNAAVSRLDAKNTSIEDAQREFRNNQAVFHQDGSWDIDVLPKDEVAVIPLYMGIQGEKRQGLCRACKYYWCVNKFASSDDIEATIQFLNWLATSDKALDIMGEQMKILLPYKEAPVPNNVFLQVLREQESGEKTMVEQYYKYGDYTKWENLMDQALEQYLIQKNSWDKVTEAFTSLW